MPQELPLFPLGTVLFPEGRLALKVFETRYMDMVTACMRSGTSFGICLIESGKEVGAPAHAHDLGVEASIEQWDMPALGVLNLSVRGGRRFRVRAQQPDAAGVVRAQVDWLPPPPAQALPEDCLALLPLLQAVVADGGEANFPPPHRLDDANWVGYRYAEILPIPVLAKQRLLELDDAGLRLSIIREFLHSRGLLGG